MILFRRITAEKNWFIGWVQQWDQLWTNCNWYDCDLLWIRFENDKCMGGYEFTFIVLGLGFRWRWNHTLTEQRQEIEEAVSDIRSGTSKSVPWNEVKARLLGEGKNGQAE